jgi:hypothetical protein
MTLALLLGVAACGETDKPQASASGSAKPAATTPKPVASAKPSATPASTPTAVASADTADDAIPTEEDFEEEAEKEITADKWDAEYALLGKEISEDKE